jgi:hypothetical protein
MMNSTRQLLSMSYTTDEFVPNKTIRAIEASIPQFAKTCYSLTMALESQYSNRSLLTRIARLEGFYKDGIAISLSEN